MRAWLALALVWTLACSEESFPDPLTFGRTESDCAQGQLSCVGASTLDADVAGIRVIHKRLVGSPALSIRVFMDGGALAWGRDNPHAQSIAARLVSGWGGGTDSASEFRSAVSALGATFGAATGADFAHVSMQAPANRFDEAFRLLAGAIQQPRFYASTSLDHAIETQIQRYDPPTQALDAASLASWQLVYEGHPYGEPRQTVDRIGELEPSDMVAAWEALRDRERLTVVVVGDVSTNEVQQAVASGLGDLPMLGGVPQQTLPALSPAAARSRILDYPEAEGWHVVGRFPAPSPWDEDYAALMVGLAALDDRLFEELRTQRGLVYSAGASLGGARANSGVVVFSSASVAQALEVMHQTLRDAQEDGFEAWEVEAARAQYITRFHIDNDTTDGLSWTLADWELTVGDWQAVDAHLDDIDAVMPEQARDALARYLPGLRWAASGTGSVLTEAMLLGEDEASTPDGTVDTDVSSDDDRVVDS